MRPMLNTLIATLLALGLISQIQAQDSKNRQEPQHASDDSAARAVIDKAIQATGGEEKLEPLKSQTWMEKGMFYGLTPNGLPYGAKMAIEWPDKARMEFIGFMTIVLNGDRGWTDQRGTVTAMPKDQLDEQKGQQYCGHVTMLLPLKDKNFTLSLLGDSTVDSQAATGVQVSHKGHRDVKLYFDKKTGLLSKSEWQVKSQEQDGKEVKQEIWYQNYKAMNGIQVPMKIVMKHDSKPYVEAEIFNVKLGAKIDPKLFEKPGK
jgi:hypothetical protein